MNKPSWERLCEIATSALHALYEADEETAKDLVNESELDLDAEEKEFFGIEHWFDEKEHTPCEYPDYDGVCHCPYSDDPTSETCRCYCGLGVDE